MPGVSYALGGRCRLPFVEIQCPFTCARAELKTLDREQLVDFMGADVDQLRITCEHRAISSMLIV